jgi:hypothetical protein
MLNQDNNNQDERKYNLRSTWRWMKIQLMSMI